MSVNTIKILAVVIIVGAISNLSVEVPDEYRGRHEITGEIESCDFRSLSRNSGQFFVGIKLKEVDELYLRENPDKNKMDHYILLCKMNERVQVTYHAEQHLVGPLRFWIDALVVPDSKRVLSSNLSQNNDATFKPVSKSQEVTDPLNVLDGSTGQAGVPRPPFLTPDTVSLFSSCNTSSCMSQQAP